MTLAPNLAPPMPAPEADPASVSPFMYRDERYGRYWDGNGVPNTRQLRRLEQGVQDLGTGEYGEHLRNIATNGIDVVAPGDSEPTSAAIYNDDFADRARAFKATSDEDEKARVVEGIVREFETDNGITLTDVDYDDVSEQAYKDLSWAASLKDSKGVDALDTLDNAIMDYRALEERAFLARQRYDEAHGKVFKGGAAALHRVKQGIGGLGVGDMVATASGKVAARMYAGKKPLNPETMSKVRRTTRTGAALVMLAGVTYLRAKGLADLHFDDGGAAADAGVADHLSGHSAGIPPAPAEHGLPTETSRLGEYGSDGHGHMDGTAYEKVREYADKHNILDDLGGADGDDFHKAVDNVLKHNDVGGDDASHAERWDAARHLSADDKITISDKDFKGLIPDDAVPAHDATQAAPAETGDHTSAAQPSSHADPAHDHGASVQKEWTDHIQDQHDAAHANNHEIPTALIATAAAVGIAASPVAGYAAFRWNENRHARNKTDKNKGGGDGDAKEDDNETDKHAAVVARQFLLNHRIPVSLVDKLTDEEAIHDAQELIRAIRQKPQPLGS